MNTKAVVLIVDDVSTNVQTLALLLKEEYDIKVATGGARALELASQDPIPDLILLDVQMPEINGYDVFKLLKEESITAKIPIIFITGKDAIEDEEYGLELGAVDYIAKPIRPSIVKARVKTHITLKQQHDQLIGMATHDQLTGLYNRHFLSDVLGKKVSESKRHNHALSVIIVDIDHFKNVNDTFGHLTGDIILKAVAKIMENSARKEDVAARFGGEEFIMVLDSCTAEDALVKAEKLRSEIEALHPEGILVTASFGVAQLQQDMQRYEDLLKNADTALYIAKEEGRNRVVLYEKKAL
ncbi:MAG: diguanylate cyclase [Epsilonproteobacteria bacterium]|nr:diguanylate cyclase [Campylobacterota bacterium]